jgi:hypothetical protein
MEISRPITFSAQIGERKVERWWLSMFSRDAHEDQGVGLLVGTT